MKKTGLVIVIIVCLIVLLSSLAAGILLTFRTIGWSALMDESNLQQRIEKILDDFKLEGFMFDERERFEIDEKRSFDLTGIKTIKITAVSEDVLLTASGDRLEASLSGSYSSFGKKIEWITEKQGDSLVLYIDYPVFGLFSSQLQTRVQIPATFTGEVIVGSVSGNCRLTGPGQCDWSLFKLKSVSGDLSIEQAEMTRITCSTVSGKIDIGQTSAQITGDTVSGNIDIEWRSFAESSLKTVSGKIELKLPAASDCKITFTTVSGNFSNKDLSIQVSEQSKKGFIGSMNNGQKKLTVGSVSGDLKMSGF